MGATPRSGAGKAPEPQVRSAVPAARVVAAALLQLSFLAILPLRASPAASGIVRSESLAPGLTHYEWRRGSATAADGSYVVVAGTERDQKLADALLAAVERAGLRPVPVYGREGYEIRVSGPRDLQDAEKARATLIAAGIAGARVSRGGHDVASPEGPFVAHILEVHPELIEVVVGHGRDAAIGLETTRDLARRRGALAAVNGGFFRVGGPLAGESEGVLIVRGRLLSEPDRGRAGFALASTGSETTALFDRLAFCAELRLPDGTSIAVDGLNRERRAGEVVVYTEEFHLTTLTSPGGVEAIVLSRRDAPAAPGEVVALRRSTGSSPIPQGGLVVSFAPGVEEAELLHPGMKVDLQWRLLPASPDPEGLWARAIGALGAGPLLLRDGERVLRPEVESISRVFAESRHPRTAVAARADGSLLLVTADGREPGWSVGMSLVELTDLLLELGAVDGVNLDGGGSTSMIVRGETVNRPSDPTGDRANGDAILLFPR